MNNLDQNTLLDSNEKHQQMARLIILRLAASWLEKQNWVSTPYGGQNPVQDLLFQAQLAANRVWQDFFSKNSNNFNYDVSRIKEQILQMSELSPELKEFFQKRLIDEDKILSETLI
ncbi:MAG: hypothetical protein H7235_10450 [Bdellovibrionaceae bacterium]|nr:hypothetical protein [Pseudobdellovibrionaceae bacterium]